MKFFINNELHNWFQWDIELKNINQKTELPPQLVKQPDEIWLLNPSTSSEVRLEDCDENF